MTITELHIPVDPARAVVRDTDRTPARWFLNGLMTTLATTEETGGAYCLMEHVLTAACNPPVHVHEVEDEAFYVLEGEIEFVVGGESIVARPGTYAFAPRGVDHYFRVLTPEARMLVITSGESPEGGTLPSSRRRALPPRSVSSPRRRHPTRRRSRRSPHPGASSSSRHPRPEQERVRRGWRRRRR